MIKKKRVKKQVKRVQKSDYAKKKGIRQGYFKPRHPEKYVGDLNNIVYRSSWELSFMNFLDNNKNVIQWGSEVIAIPYVKPTTGRVHKYYPDFWVKYKNKKGEIIQEIIEVKPEKETKPPTTKGKSKKTQLYEALTWSINKSKWKYAKIFCEKHNIKFKIITERKIFK